MPLIWCRCHSCLVLSPQGCSFSKSDYKIHQLHLQREEQNWPPASQTAVEDELFARSVADSDSVPLNPPSAMWNSREHVQAHAFNTLSSLDSVNPTATASIVADGIRRLTLSSHSESSSPHGSDDLAETFHNLNISADPVSPPSVVNEVDNFADSFNRLNITDNHTSLATSSRAGTSDLPNVTEPSPSPVNSYAFDRHAHVPRDRQENNVHTTRALKILNDIEQLMQESANKLVSSPAKSVRDDVANKVSEARAKTEKVTRSTPQINILKAKVAQHILHIDNRLVELDALFPSTPSDEATHVEYSNGE